MIIELLKFAVTFLVACFFIRKARKEGRAIGEQIGFLRGLSAGNQVAYQRGYDTAWVDVNIQHARKERARRDKVGRFVAVAKEGA